MSIVTYKTFSEPEFNEREALRYSGCREEDDATLSLLRACFDEARGVLSYKLLYTVLPVSIRGDKCDLGVFEVKSRDLAKNLSGCESVVLFASTVGSAFDRLIAKYARLSPARALMLQALGAERIEALCDAFCEEYAKESGVILKPRFSPGYGDLPLDIQKDIFAVLDCPRRIGLSLNDSRLMSPTKSVTAFAGIVRNKQ